MDGQDVVEIANLVRQASPRTSANGREFVLQGFQEVKKPAKGSIHLPDLTSLTRFLSLEQCASDVSFVEVISPVMAEAYHKNPETGEIQGVASVKFSLTEFDFDSWMPVDKFRINILTKFIPTPDSEKLIAYLSKITSKTEIRLDDDGVTTNISVSDGVSGTTMDNKTFSSILTLRPRRAFCEIQQPSAQYLLRLQKKGEEVSVALFDMNDESWKLEACNAIRNYIVENSQLPVDVI
jgi:hypothetical protein